MCPILLGRRIYLINVIHLSDFQILKNILEHVKTRELFRLRLVHSSWMDEANDILIKRRDNQLSFNFVPEDFDFILVPSPEGDDRPFSLNEVIGQSVGKFPCGHFIFDYGNLSHPKLQTFLDIHGDNIRGLQLMSEFLLRPQVGQESDEEDQDLEELEEEGEKEFDPTHLTKFLVVQNLHYSELISHLLLTTMISFCCLIVLSLQVEVK